MNDTMIGLDEFKTKALAAIDAEMANQKAQYISSSESSDPFRNIRLWHSPKGSAASARAWFVEIVESNPFFTPADVVAWLSKRIESETADKPRYYTKRHLLEVLAIVRCQMSRPVRATRESVRASFAWEDNYPYDGKENLDWADEFDRWLKDVKRIAWHEGATSRQCHCNAYSDGECGCGGYPSESNPYN